MMTHLTTSVSNSTIGWLIVVATASLTFADQPELLESSTAAQRGYDILTTKAFSFGVLSRSDFENLWKVWPDELKAKYERASDELKRQMLLDRYGLVTAPDRNDGVPLAITETPEGLWTTNCFQCHAGKVAGQVIPGLGNSHLAFPMLTNDMIRAVLLGFVKRPNFGDSGRSSGRSGSYANLWYSMSNGTTNAQVFSIELSLLRDIDLNVLDQPRKDKFANHDLDAPPFWNVKKKKRLYIDGFVPKTHRVIMQFVLSPTNSGDLIKSWENDFRDVLAWIESVEAPKYPLEIDTPLANKGQVIFAENCSRCHGTYGEHEEYPELMVSIDEVGTDSVRLTGMSAAHRRFYRESWFGEYGVLDVIEEPKGYIAPPLDGIWASAPYLHNGSVPTLWHLMHSDQRPVIWKRDVDGYDQERVGLVVTEHQRVPEFGPIEQAEKYSYFDTRIQSKSATGHEFPDELSEANKQALLEYLKTL